MANVFGKTLLGLATCLVAGSLAAQDPEALFAEGVRAFQLGDKEAALAKFQEVLAADPSHEQAFEMWRKTDRDVWRWLTLESGDVQKFANEIAARARLRRKELSRDESTINGLVTEATDPGADYGARRQAVNTLLADHGEFAVPALVEKLGDQDSKVQDLAILALHDLGMSATLPLIEVLHSDNVQVRRNVAATLSHITDSRALPALAALANGDPSEEVRYVAASAVKRIAGGAAVNAVDAYADVAERYLGGRESVVSDVVWDWVDGGLKATEVPASVYPLRIAEKFAAAAWRTDAPQAKPRSLYVRTLLAEAAAQAAAGDQGDAERAAQLRVKALALGPAALRGALQEARTMRMPLIAVEAANLLAGVAGREDVAALQAGLDDEDKRIAYACALALSDVGGAVPSAQKVVSVLANAVKEETLRTVLVVDGSEVARQRAVDAFSSGRGTVVEAAARGTTAVGNLFTYPNVDVVVVNQDLPDVVPDHVIGLVRKNDRLANTKILVIASDVESASSRFGDRVDGVIEGPLTGPALQEKVNEVLDGVDLGAKRLWADKVATAASAALARLSSAGVDLGGATTALAEQLGRGDSIAIPAAHALAASGSTAEVPALLQVITGSGSAELKSAAAQALGAILSRSETVPEGTVDALTQAMTGAESAVRQAIVGALGRAALPPGERVKLMDAIDSAASGN